MGPREEMPDDTLLNCPLLQEHPQYLVSEEPRHRLRIWGPLDRREGAVPPKQTPGDQEMHVGMPIEEAPRALDARHGTGDSRPCARSGLQQLLERLVGQAGEPGEPLAAPEERPQPPRER
jgi:hypothetical protein